MHDPVYFVWQVIALVSSMLSGALMLFFYFRYQQTRCHPGPVLVCIFLSTTLANISRIILFTASTGITNKRLATISQVANSAISTTDRTGYPFFFFWLQCFLVTAATTWSLMLALDLIFSLSNPFLPFNADNIKHHIYAWPVAVLYCVVFRFAIKESNGKRFLHTQLFLHFPAYLVISYISIALVNAWQKSRRLESHAHYTTRKMAKRILPYLSLFILIHLVTFAVYISEVVLGYETFIAEMIDQVAFLAQAFIVLFLFCRDYSIGFSSTCANSESQQERLDVSNKLRRDIMKYTSMGIMESIKQTLQSDEMQREIVYSDYNRIESMSIVVHGAIDSVVLSFRDCAPKVFHQLRRHFNIESSTFMESFQLDTILKECGSEGKSGNIFYFTANKHFMVKSVPKEEFETLVAILPHYHRYFLSNPQSRLCRYFGCHSISLPVGTRRMYFVVMQNLFHRGQVHQRFDLKGNCDRRQAIGSSQVENYIQLACDQQPIDKLMMDIDFHKLSNGIRVLPEQAEALQGQFCDDLVFLASRGIIDYSILLGVQYLPPDQKQTLFHMEHLHSLSAASLASYTASDGVVSEMEQKVYFLGIVDMLQRYNWRWKIQRWILGCLLCKDPHDVSAVPPDEYGTRLTEFVRSYLFDTSVRGDRNQAYLSRSSTRPVCSFSAVKTDKEALEMPFKDESFCSFDKVSSLPEISEISVQSNSIRYSYETVLSTSSLEFGDSPTPFALQRTSRCHLF
uniref:Phosphatidylinositol 4phosphate 5kinase (PIPKD11/GPCRPIPK) putative n=1 Tax=Albugo laibachii Nc14 TaxID=890382 RepID=F0WBI8_9STRA|nr:phosphatidylinositol 4phosphate 5kinase (PIPKD11/GPCRPIPK) putative [Albugo laibachii Nc14]|eukprot:CCA18515.1 phosphatidylinositol 4phosphate 5kinase (PIPKD11/GPCRPIPK) putative [Albugo laibachii Nc14]